MRFRPRYSLRTLFALVAIISLPIGWVTCQLRWIHQRHEFLRTQVYAKWPVSWPNGRTITWDWDGPAPWSLRIFGEQSLAGTELTIPRQQLETAHKLFPEVPLFNTVTDQWAAQSGPPRHGKFFGKPD
jgi:hypothetical protein